MNTRDAFAIGIAPTIYQDLMRNDFEMLDFDSVARLAYNFADRMIEASGDSSFMGYANYYSDGSIGCIRKTAEECNVDNSLTEIREGVVAVTLTKHRLPS